MRKKAGKQDYLVAADVRQQEPLLDRICALPCCQIASKSDPLSGVTPSGWTGSGRRFDPLAGLLLLELHGASVTERRVQPLRVLDLVDEPREIVGDVAKALVFHAIHRLHLQRLHEALGLGVVIRVPAPPHRAFEPVLGQFLSIPLRCVLLGFNRSSQQEAELPGALGQTSQQVFARLASFVAAC